MSADHLEYTSEAGIEALARAGSVAVLLPGAFYFLRETRLPPISALRSHHVPIALATDHNPGSSPLSSPLLAMNMACTLFRLTPEEALAGFTVHAARALGLQASHGTLQVGKAADFALWEIYSPAELAYAIGANPCIGRVRAGAVQRPCTLSSETTYAHSASMSSGFSIPPQAGIWFLPRATDVMKRSRSPCGNFRRSKAPCGSCMRAPWHGEQLRS